MELIISEPVRDLWPLLRESTMNNRVIHVSNFEDEFCGNY